jgi:hypothetical protein
VHQEIQHLFTHAGVTNIWLKNAGYKHLKRVVGHTTMMKLERLYFVWSSKIVKGLSPAGSLFVLKDKIHDCLFMVDVMFKEIAI